MQLISKISNLCDPDPPVLQMDRQTDGRTDDMQSQYTAVCTIVHSAVKTVIFHFVCVLCVFRVTVGCGLLSGDGRSLSHDQCFGSIPRQSPSS